MAGIFDKFLDSMKLNDEEEIDEEFEDEEFDDDDFPDDDDEEMSRPKWNLFRKEKMEDDEMEKTQESPKGRYRENVVSMRQASRGMEVCMVKSKSVEDSREICDILLSGRAVVINLEGMHTEVAQRIIDFTSGACYTLNGNLQKISNYIFIATPQSVELSGDFQDLLSENSDGSAFHINI